MSAFETMSVLALICSSIALVISLSSAVAHDCKIHGHRFEGRYNREFTAGLPGSMATADLRATLEALKESRYVCDVCVRCGERAQKGSTSRAPDS